MMTLAEASSYFDLTQVYDAYTNEPLFMAQIDPYSDSERDAMAAYRRILSVSPGTAIPAGRCIRALETIFIVGARSADGLEDLHREKYVLQVAAGLWNLGTITDYLAGQAQSSIYAFPSWVKDAKEVSENSAVSNIFEVVLPLGTPAAAQSILWSPTAAYIALSVRDFSSSLLAANCARLELNALTSVTIQQRAFQPSAGSFTLGQEVASPALRVRWQNLFEYSDQDDPRFKEGDFSLALPVGTEIDSSSLLTLDGVGYSVLDLSRFDGSIVTHLRKI